MKTTATQHRYYGLAAALVLLVALGGWFYPRYQAEQQQQHYLAQLEQLLRISLIPLDAQHQQRQRQFRRDAALLLEQSALQPALQPLLPWSKALIEQLDQQLADSSILLEQLRHWSTLSASELLANGELAQVATQLGNAGRFYADYPQHQQAIVSEIRQRIARSELNSSHKQMLANCWQNAMNANLESDRPAAAVLSRVLLASHALFSFIAEHRQQLQQPKAELDASERQQLLAELRQHLNTFTQALDGWQQLQQP